MGIFFKKVKTTFAVLDMHTLSYGTFHVSARPQRCSGHICQTEMRHTIKYYDNGMYDREHFFLEMYLVKYPAPPSKVPHGVPPVPLHVLELLGDDPTG